MRRFLLLALSGFTLALAAPHVGEVRAQGRCLVDGSNCREGGLPCCKGQCVSDGTDPTRGVCDGDAGGPPGQGV